MPEIIATLSFCVTALLCVDCCLCICMDSDCHMFHCVADVAEMVFTQCVTSNVSTQTGVTPHHPGFEVHFDYRFLDDIELAHKLLHEKSGIAEDDEADEESDRKSIDTVDSDFSSAAQESHLKVLVENETRISNDHPLMVMVGQCSGCLCETVSL